MSLTDIQVRTIKPSDKPIKISDSHGLYLLVNTNNKKLWRFNYRFQGKQKTLALGAYPAVTLADARQRHADARKLLANGIDPGAVKRAQKAHAQERAANTFGAVFDEWHAKNTPTWSQAHAVRARQLFERDLSPWLGDQPIADISPRELLKTLERIQARGAGETAHRAQQICGQVFRYGIVTLRCEHNPAADLRGALSPVKEGHHPALINPGEVAQLLNDIQVYKGGFIARCALHLWPLVIVRSANITEMEWAEIDQAGALWTIPKDKMKMDADHLVPLSKQALAILEDIKPLSGRGRYVFPGHGKSGHLCGNALLKALYQSGEYKDRMTIHGIRATFRTIGGEVLGFDFHVMEAVLAHAVPDVNGAAYNRATYLQQRRVMLQAWADYLDGLRTGTLK